MKLNGLVGKGSGKLGSSVFAISGGEQIVREYNPRVANPNTDAQVEQRAKFKLMSQLGAVLAPGLAFKKVKLTSARNQFVAKNIDLCSYEGEQAKCQLSGLQLTPGGKEFVDIDLTVTNDTHVAITNNVPFLSDIKKVIVLIAKQDDNDKLVLVDIKTIDVTTAGSFETSFDGEASTSYVVYAYGWKPNASSTSASYGDYMAYPDDDKASVTPSMKDLINSGNFTKTSYNWVNLK